MDDTTRDPALSELEQDVLDAASRLRYLGAVGVGRIQQEMPDEGVASLDLIADAAAGLAAAGYLQRTGMASYPMYLAVR